MPQIRLFPVNSLGFLLQKTEFYFVFGFPTAENRKLRKQSFWAIGASPERSTRKYAEIFAPCWKTRLVANFQDVVQSQRSNFTYPNCTESSQLEKATHPRMANDSAIFTTTGRILFYNCCKDFFLQQLKIADALSEFHQGLMETAGAIALSY
jgi:hypothetical protein